MAKKKYEWEENTDYQALINQNVKAGDFASAALNEAKRNQKISDMDAAGTNKWGATATSRYSQFLPVDNKVDGNPEEFQFETPAPTWENPYAEKESALMDSILNKGPFSYDPMSDPLYQQYASTYGREGDRAMRNTLAEAASGAGGMNSYALAAAQQAQNYYGAQLADKVPELYQMAYDMYLKDIDNEAMKLGLVQNAGQTAYNRYLDDMGIWKDNRDFAYGVDRDQRQDALAEREWQYGMTGDIRENARAEVDAIIAAGGTPSQQLLDEAGYSAEYIAAMQGLYAPQTPIYDGRKPTAPPLLSDERTATETGGVRPSEFEYVKNNIAVNIRQGNIMNVLNYVDQTYEQFTDEQWAEIKAMLNNAGINV